MTVVDFVSKRAYFILTHIMIMIARLFLYHV